MEDLQWLRESGMEALILKAAAKGTLVFGICGGYQMLGESLSDPYGVEAGGTMRGMGLLPMDTVFAEKKTRTQVTGKYLDMEGDYQPLAAWSLPAMRSIWERAHGSPEPGQVPGQETELRDRKKQKELFLKMCAEPMCMGFLTKRNLLLP